jgi:hypothetical protein
MEYDPMKASSDILSERMLREARWKDAYPAHEDWAVELEELLQFLQAHNRLDSFWPRLTGRAQERDDALQEIRVARLLDAAGYPVVLWEPPGNGNYIGEFSVGGVNPPVFVEVKSPGWEAQLSQEERAAGRAKQEKYQEQELRGGADGPWQPIRQSIRKAYPKFRSDQPNLLVIADDRFMSLTEWGKLAPEQALFIRSAALDSEAGYFTTNQFENLGGIALFSALNYLQGGLQYKFLLYPNSMAQVETALPTAFVRSFS